MSGGRLRVEPDGESFIRSICMLAHIGSKQYAKGKSSTTNHKPNFLHPFALKTPYKSRRLLRNGKYNTIPSTSKIRQRVKPYALRMNPFPNEEGKITTDMQITYLTKLLHLMINEDLRRPFETTARPEDQKLVRRLPVLSEQHLNPESVRLKALQESTVAAMASPKDNPWIARLQEEYMGKILYDGGYFRAFMIRFVPNKGNPNTCTPLPHPKRAITLT